MEKKKLVIGAGVGVAGIGALAAVGGALLLVVGIVAALFLLPMALAGPVKAKIDSLIAENVDADIALGGVELSLIQSFPRLSVVVRDVEIKNHAPFEGTTLAKLPELGVDLDLWSVLMGNTFQIQGISLVKPEINVIIDESGAMNTSIAKSSGEAPAQAEPEAAEGDAQAFNLRLHDLGIEGANVRFEDRRDSGMLVALEGIDFDLQGDFSGDLNKVQASGSIERTSAKAAGITWLSEAKTSVQTALDYTISTGAMAFGPSKLTVNAFPLGWKGSITPDGADYLLDLGFEIEQSEFAALLSLVPSAFASDLQGLSSAGTLAFSGTAKGRYSASGSYPAFEMALAARDARFQYPELPAVENIDIDIDIEHPEGDLDAMVIDIKHFGFRTADAPFDGKTRIANPMTDPDVAASLKGRIDLAALRSALPAQKDSLPATGQLDLDLDLAGRVSAFQAANVEAVSARGGVRAKDLRPPTEDWPGDMRLASLDLAFSPERVDVNDLKVLYGKSDLAATGQFNNLVGYALGVGVLSGALDVTSRHLDLRPFQGDSTEEPVEEPAEGEGTSDDGVIAPVPKDVDIIVNGQFGRVVTELFSVDNAHGKVIVQNQEARLEDMRADAFGGEVTLAGKYAAKDAESADLDINIDSYRLDIAKLVKTFTTFKQLAPILSDAVGTLNAGFSLVTRLNKDGSPVVEELSSSGLFGFSNLTLRPKSLETASSKLGNSAYEAINFANSKLSYTLDKGMFTLEPTQVKLGTASATLRGSAGVIAKTIDMRFDTQLPTKSLEGTPLLSAAKKAFGPKIDVSIGIVGPWDSPKVAVGVEGIDSVGEAVEAVVGAVVGAVASDLLAEAQRQGDALIAEARKVAADLLSKAEDAGDKLRDEAKKQGNKLVNDAKNPIAEIAAKEAKKALESEADKAADKLVSEAKKQGDKLVDEAEDKKNDLIASAQAKAGGSPAPSASKAKTSKGK